MSKWLLRGLVFAALMVFVRLVQGAADQRVGDQGGVDQHHPGRALRDRRVRLGVHRRPCRRPGQPRPRPPRGPGDDVAAGRPVRRNRQRRGRVVDLAVLQGPVCRWAGQRAHHVRGIHRAAGLPCCDRRRSGRALCHRPARRQGAAAAPWPCRHRRGPRGHRRVRRRAPPDAPADEETPTERRGQEQL